MDTKPADLSNFKNGDLTTLSRQNSNSLFVTLQSPKAKLKCLKMSDFQGENRSTCSVGQETCKHDVNFTDGEEECVTLDGILFDGLQVGQVLFRKSGRVCASDGESTAEVTSLSFLPGNLTSAVGRDLGVLRSNRRRHL